MAAGVLVMLVLAGTFVVVSRRQGQAGPAGAQASTPTEEKVPKPDETHTASGKRADSTSTLATLFDPSLSGQMTGRRSMRQTEVFPQPLGTDEDLSAADAMKSEPETAAGKTETGSNQPSATAIAESLVPPAFTPKPMAPGGSSMRISATWPVVSCPRAGTRDSRTSWCRDGPETAVAPDPDPARAERITLPHADLTW